MGELGLPSCLHSLSPALCRSPELLENTMCWSLIRSQGSASWGTLSWKKTQQEQEPGGLCWWDVNSSRLFITNPGNGLGNVLQREGVSWGCLCSSRASWNPLKHSDLWRAQPLLCDVLDEFGRCDGGGGGCVYHQRGMSEGLCGTFRLEPV